MRGITSLWKLVEKNGPIDILNKKNSIETETFEDGDSDENASLERRDGN